MLLKEGKGPEGNGVLMSCDWTPATLLKYSQMCSFIAHLCVMIEYENATHSLYVGPFGLCLISVSYYFSTLLSNYSFKFLVFFFERCLMEQRKPSLKINHRWLPLPLAMSM